jgi:hypothetical protein
MRKPHVHPPRDQRPYRLARVVKTVKGKFSLWRKGELVRVRDVHHRSCSIDRDKWKGSLVELANVCCGVPLSFVKFLPKAQQPKFPKQTALSVTVTKIIHAPAKVWNRNAVFSKWELDAVELLAKQVRGGVIDKNAAKNVLQILKTKKL